jgi:hypothetical protein
VVVVVVVVTSLVVGIITVEVDVGAVLEVELAATEDVVVALVGVVLVVPLLHAAASAPTIVARDTALDHCLTVMLDLVSDAR